MIYKIKNYDTNYINQLCKNKNTNAFLCFTENEQKGKIWKMFPGNIGGKVSHSNEKEDF